MTHGEGLKPSNAHVEARRSRQSSAAVEDTTLHAPQMPTRKPVNPTVVIAPRSPLEFEGDSDYEGSSLNALSHFIVEIPDFLCV